MQMFSLSVINDRSQTHALFQDVWMFQARTHTFEKWGANLRIFTKGIGDVRILRKF